MSDEQSPEANMSKRERQKARRAQRLEAERAAAQSAQRRRLAGFIVVGLLIVGAIGFVVQRNLAERAAERELIEEAQARLGELGCTDVVEMPPQGAGHFEDGQVTQNPPEAVYEHLPTTSGRHIANWVMTGVFDDYVDERLTTHNLEHGYVVLWYSEDADPDQVEALKAFGQERIDDGDQDLVVAAYNQPLEDGASFAYTSWERRQLCDEFDPGVALGFVNENMNNPRAPEAAVGPHLGGGDGLDPAEDPVVFPPLADAAPGPRVPEEGAGDPDGDDGQDPDDEAADS